MDTLVAGFDWLATEPGRLLVWGVYIRLMGVMLMISLGAIAYQIVPMAGAHSLMPSTMLLRSYYRDFKWKAFYYWPTLFWFSSSDLALQLVPLLGFAAGACVALGFCSWWAVVIGYICFISVDAGGIGMGYPWDSFLGENLALCMTLPAVKSLLPAISSASSAAAAAGSGSGPFSLASLEAEALPSALQAWCLRWLLFRVLFGFGKLKFTGSGWRDRLYIKSFLIVQPMLSQLGHRVFFWLPDAAFTFSLISMWLIEIPFPVLLLLFSGAVRAAMALSIMALMMGIHLTGNFGYFNVLTAFTAVASLDHSSVLSWSMKDLFSPSNAAAGAATTAAVQAVLGAVTSGDVAALASALPTLLQAQHLLQLAFPAYFFLYYLPSSLLQFISSSWTNYSLPFWSGIYRLKLPLLLKWSQLYAAVLRATVHLKLCMGYGVFPPQTPAPQRWAVVMEGSEDGKTWRRYEYQHYLSSSRTAPAMIAPYHPRFCQSIFYESNYYNPSTLTALLTHNNPYYFPSSSSVWQRVMLRLMEGGQAAKTMAFFFKTNPFPDPQKPPKYMRALACQYMPLPLEQALATGEYWQERVMAVHVPTYSLQGLAAEQPGAKMALAAVQQQKEKEQKKKTAGGVEEVAPLAPSALPSSWPWTDCLAEGPEDFWCEQVFMRRAAGYTRTALTAAAYEEVWQYVKDVRLAAAGAAQEAAQLILQQQQQQPKGQDAEEADAAGGSDMDTASEGGSRRSSAAASRRRASSPSSSSSSSSSSSNNNSSSSLRSRKTAAASVTPTPAAAGAAAAAHVKASSPSTTSSSAVEAWVTCGLSMTELSEQQYRRLTMDPAALKAAAAAVLAAPAPHLPGLEESRQLFCWSLTPGTVQRLRSKYSAADLSRIRHSLGRVMMPLVLACERLFDRQPSEHPASAVKAGAGPVIDPSSISTAADVLAAADEMIAGVYQDTTHPGHPSKAAAASAGSPSSQPLPDQAHGLPIYYFGGNDDAAVEGSMRNPLRWQGYLHSLLLLGDRQGYERALQAMGMQLEKHVLLRHLPTSLKQPEARFIANAPLEKLAEALTLLVPSQLSNTRAASSPSSPSSAPVFLHPGRVATEQGTFLHMTLSFHDWVYQAIGFNRMQGQGRVNSKRSTAPEHRTPPFLPAVLELVPRLSAHRELRQLYDSAGDAAVGLQAIEATTSVSSRSGRQGNLPVRPVAAEAGAAAAGGFYPAPRTTRWFQTEDQSWWSFEGVHALPSS